MWAQVLLTVLGAMLSSALTLGLAAYVFERRYKDRLRREIEERADEYAERLRQVLDEEIEKAGEMVEQRVRQGVLKAVADIPSSEVLQDTTQNVVQTGVDLVEAGLHTFLGTKPRKR